MDCTAEKGLIFGGVEAERKRNRLETGGEKEGPNKNMCERKKGKWREQGRKPPGGVP